MYLHKEILMTNEKLNMVLPFIFLVVMGLYVLQARLKSKAVLDTFIEYGHAPGGEIEHVFTKNELITKLREREVVGKGLLGRIKSEIILRLVHPESFPNPGIYFEKQHDGKWSVEIVYQDF